jgi:acyl-CoA thioesterase
VSDIAGAAWLGLERVDDHEWRLPVTQGVISGANALFGGCATAAGLVVARALVTQPLVWGGCHFGTLAPLGNEVTLHSRVIASGRTVSHVEVMGSFSGKEAFLTRATAGERPPGSGAGDWTKPVTVLAPDNCSDFPQPVHESSWAARFEWRLAGTSPDDHEPWAAWWVRPRPGEPADPLVTAVVLVDYVTYGMGRALGFQLGGLSIDNVVRLHHLADAPWLLLVVRPGAITGGFGHGSAFVYADGTLVASGSQSIVVNNWDWRLPVEREVD